MAFGDNYAAVYTAPQLEDGEYIARIDSATLQNYSNGNEYCLVKVSIKDHPGYNPNTITLNSAPKLGEMKANGTQVTQSDVDRVNRQITTFFQCFGIPEGNFNLAQWKGHTGTVRVAPQYDKNEADHKSRLYKQIFPQVPKAEKAPAPVQKPAQAARPAQAQSQESFPEDIPF